MRHDGRAVRRGRVDAKPLLSSSAGRGGTSATALASEVVALAAIGVGNDYEVRTRCRDAARVRRASDVSIVTGRRAR